MLGVSIFGVMCEILENFEIWQKKGVKCMGMEESRRIISKLLPWCFIFKWQYRRWLSKFLDRLIFQLSFETISGSFEHKMGWLESKNWSVLIPPCPCFRIKILKNPITFLQYRTLFNNFSDMQVSDLSY